MIALVPWAERKNAQSYKNNVMKYACYGHDERAGKYQYGDCKHPCNTRPGCEYQSSKKTFENYSLRPLRLNVLVWCQGFSSRMLKHQKQRVIVL